MFSVEWVSCAGTGTTLFGGVLTVKFSGNRVCRIQHYVANCCGLNTLHGFNVDYLQNPAFVESLISYLKTEPWKALPYDKRPDFPVKHFFFTTGIGPLDDDEDDEDEEKGIDRSDCYKHLIERPEVKLIHRYPSASEPGHDVAIFFVDLT